MVIITHYSWTDQQRILYLFPFWVDMAVPIFMIMSGYVYSKSMKKRMINTLSKAYEKGVLISRIIRFTVPFCIVFIIEEVALIIHDKRISIFSIVQRFITGGTGPGSYYFPVMIQFVFYFPILYFIIKKYKDKGLIYCFVINAVYEILKSAYCLNEECYRLLVFRYTFIIAFGCYLALHGFNIKRIILLSIGTIGLVYILLFKFLSFTPLITVYWTGTSFLACLFIVPIMYYFFKSEHEVRFKLIELIGKASFDIFLVQMVYYSFMAGRVYAIFDCTLIKIGINIVVCLSLGIIFYLFEKQITKKILIAKQ